MLVQQAFGGIIVGSARAIRYIGAMPPSDNLQTAAFFGQDNLELFLFILLLALVIVLFARCYFMRHGAERNHAQQASGLTARPQAKRQWHQLPELQLLMLALPLHLLWEIAQFPLYTIWHEADWVYILYSLAHCTLGDMLILLCVFWLVSLLNRSRYWVYATPIAANAALFTLLGVAYTVYSEIVNTRIKGAWAYTELMPIVPVFEIGGAPFLQWLLISPVLIWLMRLTQLALLQRQQPSV